MPTVFVVSPKRSAILCDGSPKGEKMGKPVVHFEIVARDGEKLKGYYAELFGWEIDSSNPMNYGLIDRAANLNSEGIGVGGGIGQGPDGYEGHVTFYAEVPDVEESLQKAESLGGTRMMGPERIMEGVELGQFKDPEGNVIGLIKSAS
jgi:predicted enzyme related to lactoylglutathione lyase